MFESGVAEVAATKATEAQIYRMEQNYERMQEEVPTLSKYVHTDLGFHMLVCECTQNPRLSRSFVPMKSFWAPLFSI